MSDLTLLMATANIVLEETASRIRAALLEVTRGQYPIVTISQRPLDFGRNVCVGRLPIGKYSGYRQLYIGAQVIETRYTAVIDDDVLYAPEHFEHRPPPHVFFYETNCWFMQLERDYFWRPTEQRHRAGGMWGCIAETESLRANLEARYKRFPEDPTIGRKMWFGEPGIKEGDREYGVSGDTVQRIHTEQPCLVFIHPFSMGFQQWSRYHRRYGLPAGDNRAERIEPWGTPSDVRRKYWEL